MTPLLADVSVVMPAFNNETTLGRALASIAAQTLPPKEVIVVDDGSVDGTAAVAAQWRDRLNGARLYLFRQQNMGAGAARNRALKAATAEWIAFLDADDEWLPWKLERSLAEMGARGLTMSSHNLYGVSPAETRIIDSKARFLRDPAKPFLSLFLRGFISSSTVVVRRADVLRVGGFDPTLRSAQDYELWLALLARPETRFATFADPLLRYTLAEDGITSRVDRKVACSLDIVRRHMGHLQGWRAWFHLALRVAIIHKEAIDAHRSHGDTKAALAHVRAFPGRLLHLFRCPAEIRPDFLAAMDDAEETT